MVNLVQQFLYGHSPRGTRSTSTGCQVLARATPVGCYEPATLILPDLHLISRLDLLVDHWVVSWGIPVFLENILELLAHLADSLHHAG